MRRRSVLQRGLTTSAMLGAGFAPVGVAMSRTAAGGDEGSERDRRVMRELAAFARRSFTTASPMPFAAAIVRTASGESVARALNEVGPLLDPTAHGEVQAIRAACRRLKRVSLSGCTLYTTAEPCAMCMAAVLWAGIERVVYGATIDDLLRHIAQIRMPARELANRGETPCELTGTDEPPPRRRRSPPSSWSPCCWPLPRRRRRSSPARSSSGTPSCCRARRATASRTGWVG